MSGNVFMPIWVTSDFLFRVMLPLGLAVTSGLHLGVWEPVLRGHILILYVNIVNGSISSQIGPRIVLERASTQTDKDWGV
jgi:hypothetical protein